MNRHLDQELRDYAMEQLNGKRRAKVERHLAACLNCSAQLSEVRQMVNTVAIKPKRAAFRLFSN